MTLTVYEIDQKIGWNKLLNYSQKKVERSNLQLWAKWRYHISIELKLIVILIY